MSRLQAMEDQLIGESVPVNSEAELQKKSWLRSQAALLY
jgi:hypothetical protein